MHAKLTPFSHKMPATWLLPFSEWKAAIYPIRLELSHLTDNKSRIEINFTLLGPVKNFTSRLNLQNGTLTVFGQTKEGYFSYDIECKDKRFYLILQRCPRNEIMATFNDKTIKLIKGKPLLLKEIRTLLEKRNRENIFLGIYKKQLVEDIEKRKLLNEIIPFWYALSGFFPSRTKVKIFEPLRAWEKTMIQHDKVMLEDKIMEFFSACFSTFFIPRFFDDQYQGIIPANAQIKNRHVSDLLIESAKLLRKMFLEEIDDELKILPCIVPSLHAGSCENFELNCGTIDFEWSKKIIRKVIITADKSCAKKIVFQKKVKSFRFYVAGEGGKKIKMVLNDGKGADIVLEKGKKYCFDNFQK